MKKGLKNFIIILSTVMALVICSAAFFFFSSNKIKMVMQGEANITVNLGEAYTDAGCKAYYKAIPLKNISSDGEVDTNKIGTYTITYTAKFNTKTATAQRKVKVVDTILPVIEAPESVEVPIGMNLTDISFDYRVSDNYDGDITARAVFKYDENAVTVSATDCSGNCVSKTVAIKRVADTTPPALNLSGFGTFFLRLNTEFKDPGYIATDNIDGNITHKIKISGDDALDEIGTHTITYTVTDSSQNVTVKERKIVVYDPETPPNTIESGKVVYLTFDDGPCVYTPQILEILKRYDVKASFFVTNQKPDWQYLIGQAAAEGHTIAAHTLTHQYSIYRNNQTYFEDLNSINEIIKAQTGSYTRFIRFPGGSSNTISRKYCHGIMSQLVREVTEQNYIYFDWNVNSGDADGSRNQRDPQYIASNVINNLKDGQSVVLMHDVNPANIEALPIIIEYGLSNGIRFLPISDSSPTAHHGVFN